MSELGIFYPTIPNGVTTNVTLTTDGDNLAGNISLADFKTALESGVVLLSFPTVGDADVRAVVEHTDDSTNGLKVGVFSEDTYIVYSVVDDDSDGVTLTVVSEKSVGSPIVELGESTSTILMADLQTFIGTALSGGNEGTFVVYSNNHSAVNAPEISTIAQMRANGIEPLIQLQNGSMSVVESEQSSSEDAVVFRYTAANFRVSANMHADFTIDITIVNRTGVSQQVEVTMVGFAKRRS